MIDILIMTPEGAGSNVFSCLEEHGYRCTRVMYREGPSMDQMVQTELLFFILNDEGPRRMEFLADFRQQYMYIPVLIARPIDLSRTDEVSLFCGCDSIIDVDASEVCVLHRVASLLSRIYIKRHKIYIFDDSTTLDADSHCLGYCGKVVHLGPQIFKVIEFLACHPGLYFTPFQLLERIGEPADTKSLNAFRMKILKLRRVVRENGGGDVILSKYGQGYGIMNVKVAKK